jgi:hypothetical protein
MHIDLTRFSALVLILLQSTVSLSNECGRTDLTQEYAEAASVFVGRADAPEESSDQATFLVLAVWIGMGDRGPVVDSRIVLDAPPIPIIGGEDYIVFGFLDGDEESSFRFRPCTNTAPVFCSPDTLKWLGTPAEGQVPEPETPLSVTYLEPTKPFPCLSDLRLRSERKLQWPADVESVSVVLMVDSTGLAHSFALSGGNQWEDACKPGCSGDFLVQLRDEVAEWQFNPLELNGESVDALILTITEDWPNAGDQASN